MDKARIEQQLLELPLFQYDWMETSELVFSERVRWICQTQCPMYNTTWACPPAVGTVEECKARCLSYPHALMMTSITEVSDIANLEETLATHPYNIIETNDEGGNEPTTAAADALGLTREAMRVRIAGGVGQLAGELFASPAVGTLLLTGGDTLLQCMNSVGIHELEPICEMEHGVVLTRFSCGGITRYVITKSGGFGHADLLTELAGKIKK